MTLKNFQQFIGAVPILEQTTLLNIALPNILITSGDTAKQIKLKGTDPATGQTMVLKYTITGEYGLFDFGVLLRNITRGTRGNLTAEAKPTNSLVAGTMKKLVPTENQTGDGWLLVDIPKEKINAALVQLKKSQGTKANIDAGNGVTIGLTRAV